MSTLLHAMVDLQQRGAIDQELLRESARKAVLSMAKDFLSTALEKENAQ
ncbi:hypothetical protein [Duganella sp. Root336D2]|nr:hypothetical protein [Duganella sp. Root336D2]